MSQDSWSPMQYDRFREERAQPFRDLLAMVEARPTMRIVDLGCGTGELTRELHRRLGAVSTLGIDRSSSMLAESEGFVEPGLSFAEGDIAGFAPAESYDLVFSNAALHWLPDHESLIPRLFAHLAPDGQLAVQVPANHGHPSHTLAHEIAGREPFSAALGGYQRASPVLAPERYAQVLHDAGAGRQRVRLEVYGHLLAGAEEVVEWVKGTLLTDYQSRLPGELWDAYLEEYRRELMSVLGGQRPYFYPFQRILFWAER
ncbi:MAG TPA: methyltransferase domain-containing protein [Thermoanaerobaculia bacterium]|nr:methyltransferase domain-containing protein [Thermoanaerobaculia bacterium]